MSRIIGTSELRKVPMPYEIFTRKLLRPGTPVLSFTKIGQINFNQIAAKALQQEPIETVLLLWDAAERKVAIKPTSNKKDPRSYRIRYFDRGNGGGFAAKTFCDYIGLDYSQRRSVPIEINLNSELLVEVKLPEAFFKKRTDSRIVLAKGKTG